MGLGTNPFERCKALIKKILSGVVALAIIGAATYTIVSQDTEVKHSNILIDGSSTVAPLTEAAAETYKGDGQVIVDISGTGGGFKRFCAGETAVQNASRHIKQEEIDACKAAGIEWYEFEIAFDGITVVVNQDNTWADCLTVDQLDLIWGPTSTVKTWKDVDKSFPDEPINLYGPGTDSGTFDYFTKVVSGEEGLSRTEYTPSEDDNVTVEGVSGDAYALGYMGYSYAINNADRLKIVQIDSGAGCVTPSAATIQSGEYSPLSRPLFLYVSANALAQSETQQFMRHYLDTVDQLVVDTGLISAPTDEVEASRQKLERAILGDEAADSLDIN